MATQNERTGHFLIEQCPVSTNVALTVGGIPRHEEKANADLLAAAPELYQALDTYLKTYARTDHHPNVMEEAECINIAHAALAKARGESQ